MDINEIVEGRRDWNGEPDPAALRRREKMLDAMSPDDKRLLTNMVGAARSGREELLREYANSLRDFIMSDSLVGTTLRPRRLLQFAGRAGDDEILRYEAVSIFDLACLQMWVEQRPSCSRYVVGEDMSKLLDELIDQVFVGGKRKIAARTLHNPDDSFRVSAIAFDGAPLDGPPEYVRAHLMRFRVADDLLVMVDHRPKGLFEAVIKMLKQLDEKMPDWSEVYDRRGYRMVVQRVEDIERLFVVLERFAASLDMEFVRVGSNVTAKQERVRQTNAQSSGRFRAAKVRLIRDGQPYEIQVMTAQDYISSRLARDDENHDLYRLRQLRDCYGELLWPKAIYGVDWQTEADVGGPLYNEALAKLNWRTARRR